MQKAILYKRNKSCLINRLKVAQINPRPRLWGKLLEYPHPSDVGLHFTGKFADFSLHFFGRRSVESAVAVAVDAWTAEIVSSPLPP